MPENVAHNVVGFHRIGVGGSRIGNDCETERL